ncbi:MAG: hypothetical protein AB1714_00810 [Acidobacteriota bacterium]
MGADDLTLPRMENVRVVSPFHTRLMEIADPVPELYRKLDVKQLIQVAAVGLRFQEKMIAVDMERLKLEREALVEMQKLIEGLGR